MVPWAIWGPRRTRTLARITCRYDSYVPITEYMNGAAQLNKATLECDAHVVKMIINVDENGKEIGIARLSGADIRAWNIVRGNKEWPFVKAELIIRGVFSASNLTNLAPLVGKFNSDACTNILGAGIGDLWFTRLQFRQLRHGSAARYEAKAFVAFNADGWDAHTVIREQKLVVRNVPLKDEAGTANTGEMTPAWTWVDIDPTGTSDVNVLPLKKVAFSYLNGLLT